MKLLNVMIGFGLFFMFTFIALIIPQIFPTLSQNALDIFRTGILIFGIVSLGFTFLKN